MAKQFDNSYRPLPISELLSKIYHFEIPSFQRGYRWERKQVKDLLDDLYSFSVGDQASYFLQPLVVKSIGSPEDNKWEVLDGQQRLTTMLLFLKKVISELMVQAYKAQFEKRLYDISYTIRPDLDFDNPNPQKTIDGFYLAEAKGMIDRWFDEKINGNVSVNLDGFKNFLFKDNPKQVKFIWYEISPDSTELSSINVQPFE